MSFPVIIFVFFLLFLWLCVVSFFLFRQYNQQKIFMKGSELTALPEVLATLDKSIKKNEGNLEEIQKRTQLLEVDAKVHIQKIGLMRFNPFKDTGGDQSFVLSLLDAHDSGLVISALYSRSGTRWYAKKVHAGKGLEYDLSEDEQKAIKLAKQSKNS